MKEDKSTFLKVDCVEPVYKDDFSPFEYTNLNGIKVWINGNGHLFPCDRFTVCDPDVAREDGRQQGVELAKELWKMKLTDKEKLFGYWTAYEILSRFSYKEIVEKLDNWKREKETIRVRDEVYSQSMQLKFVVTKIFTSCEGEDVTVNGLKKDGTAIKGLLLCNVKKTGLHVDDLDSYLEA